MIPHFRKIEILAQVGQYDKNMVDSVPMTPEEEQELRNGFYIEFAPSVKLTGKGYNFLQSKMEVLSKRELSQRVRDGLVTLFKRGDLQDLFEVADESSERCFKHFEDDVIQAISDALQGKFYSPISVKAAEEILPEAPTDEVVIQVEQVEEKVTAKKKP